MPIKSPYRKTSGFTLTEVAIVLGIVGLILGAVWVAAASVYDNMRSKRTNELILQIVQGVRSAYATSSTTGLLDNANMVPALLRAGIIPKDMVDPTNVNQAVNPWTNTANSLRMVALGGGTAFGIRFLNLPQKACANILTSNTANSVGTGLVAAVGNGTTPTVGSTPVAQISIVQASSTPHCTATASTNQVWLVYKLKT